MGEVEKITDGIHEAFTASQGANNNLVNSVDIKWQKNDGFLHFIWKMKSPRGHQQ